MTLINSAVFASLNNRGIKTGMLSPPYREIFSSSPHVHPEHRLKDANGLFFPGSLTKKAEPLKPNADHLFQARERCFLHTSTRNLGLSGMKTKMKAEVRLGMEQRATNILQLWKPREPSRKKDPLLGITIQARPGETQQSVMNNSRLERLVRSGRYTHTAS